MRNTELVAGLKEVFAKHGGPGSGDHDWAAHTYLLVLIAEGVEAILTTASELQASIGGLGDRVTALESSMGALVVKAASSPASPPPASDPLITQDQLDSMGAAVASLATRLDSLQSSAGTALGPVSVTPNGV